MMKSVCVFCASSTGENPVLMKTAFAVGAMLAREGITVVYGGAQVGLMGAVADGALAENGRVIGVLPKFLSSKEIAHAGLTELHIVSSMHERKMRMFELSEGFIALPGGFGTLEEVTEVLTWQQLNLHRWPIGFLNVDGFYDHLLKFFDQMDRAKVLRIGHREMAIASDRAEDLLKKMRTAALDRAAAQT